MRSAFGRVLQDAVGRTLSPHEAILMAAVYCGTFGLTTLPTWGQPEARGAGDGSSSTAPAVFVLGIAQDAGFPQAGCRKDCCLSAWTDHRLRRFACCLAIVEPSVQERNRSLPRP